MWEDGSGGVGRMRVSGIRGVDPVPGRSVGVTIGSFSSFL